MGRNGAKKPAAVKWQLGARVWLWFPLGRALPDAKHLRPTLQPAIPSSTIIVNPFVGLVMFLRP